MNKLRTYQIPFVGLKEKTHRFEFEIDDEFFALFDNEEIKGSKIKVDLDFDKRVNFFVLDFYIGGSIEVNCDRCLEQFRQELLDEFRVYVKFDDQPKEKKDESEDVIFIASDATHFDVSQLIYEFINLSIPVQKFCPTKAEGGTGCNEEVLKILQQKKEETKQEDPRWAALKKLKVKSE